MNCGTAYAPIGEWVTRGKHSSEFVLNVIGGIGVGVETDLVTGKYVGGNGARAGHAAEG